MSTQVKAGLAIIAVMAALWFAWTKLASSTAPGAEGPLAATGGATARTKGKTKGVFTAADVPDVVGNLAHQRPGETFVRERSLFDFAKSPEKVAEEDAARKLAADAAAAAQFEAAKKEEERRKQLAEQAAQQAIRDAEMRKQQQLAPKPPPQPPAFPHQYIGTIGPADAPFAILFGTADRKYRYARAGDLVDEKFRIEHVGLERLDISYTEPQFAGRFANVDRSRDSISEAQPRR